MNEINPYQTPVALPDPDAIEHRSFRLTSGSFGDQTNETFWGTITFSLFQQVPLLVVTSLLLDGGLMFKRVGIAAVLYWTITLIIMIRRDQQLSQSDMRMLKWGYLPLLGITMIVNAFWSFGN